MGSEFLGRVRQVTLILTILVAPGAAIYVQPMIGVAILLGSLWSLANLLWIEALGRLSFAALKGERPEPGDTIKLLVGVPVLLLGGWALLASPLSVVALMLGFWILFAVVVLKALGIALARALDFATGRSTESAAAALRRPLPSRRAQGVVGWVMVAVLAGGMVLWATASSRNDSRVDVALVGEEITHEQSSADHGSGEEHGAAATHGGGEEHGEGSPPHLPTVPGLLHGFLPDSPWAAFLYQWENVFFALLATFILVLGVRLAFARPKLIPGRGQALVEALAQGMTDFAVDTFGPHMARFVPFVGTLFLYILIMNWMGLVPFLKSSTADINTTLGMAIVVFFFAQYTAIRSQGIGGYLFHLAGEPRNVLGWMVAVLLFPIEVMGEFIKPLSLAARLFGNVFGEDLLIAVFVGIGAALMAWQPIPIGFPIHVLFVALALVMGAVQALVFALLATVYLYMAQPHGAEAESHGAESAAQPAHA